MGERDPRPVPEPDEVSRFFWEGAAQRQLVLQRCSVCRRFQYPPEVCCVYCQSTSLIPTQVSGIGTLYSFAVVERPFHAGFVDTGPYIVGLIELGEQEGLKVLTNIVEADAGTLRIGQPLEVVFEVRGELSLPQFRPVASASSKEKS